MPSENDPNTSTAPLYPRIESADVVICTWNRREQLSDTLDSLTRLIVPYDRLLRIIIVDNNSNDGSAELIKEFAGHKFFKRHRLLSLFEPQQGHTFARNRAVQHLDSDLVLWTDDDVVVDSFWLKTMIEFADDNQDVSFFGGPIIANLLPTKPDWIEENWDTLMGCFAERNLGEKPLDFSKDRLPYGANFAVRTAVQKEFLFNTELGRRGDDVFGEDELQMMRRLIDAGLSGKWNPESKVTHVIPADRVNEEYVRQYFLGQGRALVRKVQTWGYSPRKLWWSALGNYLAFRFKRKFARSPRWLAHLIRSGLAEGQYKEQLKNDAEKPTSKMDFQSVR